MEWQAPAIVLETRLYGEHDIIAAVFTEEHGLHRGLARGGAGRAGAALWQAGNLVTARWVGRLADQLGHLSAELVHPAAALVLEDALALAMLRALTATAAGALAERQAHARLFAPMLSFIAALTGEEESRPALLADYVRLEAALLGELGYGLALDACALTGARTGLAFVSPRSGRAVTADAAGQWAGRLLRLPGFLAGGNAMPGPADWRDGLALTGHFLARDAFGHHHRPLPAARIALFDRVAALAGDATQAPRPATEPSESP
ncbi:MAG: DNA repair protein RecO [Rhodospirillales bacterium]|nr:DNA repair protein RecO [Rhodospirillales bacterium]